MKVIIAEKPSVAQQIAAVVGATTRREGYIEGGGYAVTWAFGHLVGPAMPEAYGIEGFKRENLPILPETFILEPRRVKSGKEYKPDPGAVKQLAVLKELFSRAERIVVATDAGREGELISVLSITISTARRLSSGCGSAASPSGPSARGWQPYVPAASMTTSTSRPEPAARRIGSWASTLRRHSPSPPDAAHGRWGGCRPPRWLWCAGAIWKTPHSRRRPISGSNSTRPKTLRRSPPSRRRNTIRKRRRTKPVPQSGAATACRL